MSQLDLNQVLMPVEFASDPGSQLDALRRRVSDDKAEASRRVFQERQSERSPFSAPVALMGLDESLSQCSAAICVEGRNISAEGISIVHEIPLPFRFVALQLPGEDTVRVAKFAWCRYVGDGEYISGGRFLNLKPKLAKASE